ncbi:glycopeptide antibiotics resistance protein [Peribacillus sp. B2I2]
MTVFNIGIFDVDDLLLNTFGGMIGYALFKFGI